MEEVSNNEGRTILFVSHNIESLKTICTSSLLLHLGQIKAVGNINEVIYQYQSSFLDGNIGNVYYTCTIPKNRPYISSAKIKLQGKQPYHVVVIDLTFKSSGKNRKGLIVVDVFNSSGICIYQVIPQIDPFIDLNDVEKAYSLSIDCTGLIPDVYSVSLWLGPGLQESYDWVKKALSFEITDSPTKRKTSNYTAGNGFIAPVSKISEA